MDAFPSSSQPPKLTPSLSFSDATTAVQQHQVDYAIIPFENSTNGSVVQTLDLLADRDGLYNDIEVCAEHYLTVHHCFMVRKPREDEKNGAAASPPYSAISKLYTHSQAWGQCEHFLDRHFKGVERHNVSSTSKAAEIVVNETTEHAGAIASRFAAEYHGAQIIDENIEDRADNTTRFLILRNVRSERSSRLLVGRLPGSTATPMALKTLVLFTLDHNSPGALTDALAVFKDYGMNLTSINTRPTQKRAWQYVFFVECKRDPAHQGQEAVTGVLKSLQKVTESCRYYGTWCDQL